jgi:transposase-like protein
MECRKFAPKGPLSRSELQLLVDSHRSIREIARELDRSPSTVRYWLDRYDLKVPPARSLKARSLAARAVGKTRFLANCPKHGEGEFLAMANGRSRCSRCNAEAVSKRRRKVKGDLVAEAGGCCSECGYDHSQAALQFHHLDPSSKAFAIAGRGVSRSITKARAEAGKCVLLCANCHAEVEAGVRELS